MSTNAARVLIYRLGSLGDTVVALPALRRVAAAFPDAQRVLLTQRSADPRAADIEHILHGTTLVHGSIRYPLRTRSPHVLLRLRREIRAFNPDVLIYLAEPRGWWKTVRDVAFFHSCGIHRFIGVPYRKALRLRQPLGDERFEFEGDRLLRCLHSLATANVTAADGSSLQLTDAERLAARNALAGLPHGTPTLAISLGAKVDVKDWGEENWTELLRHLHEALPGWGLAAVGAAVERVRTDAVLAAWSGPAVNLCGALSVRESAAVLERARVFVGHDSGPIHLAAALGTPCVGIFSSRDLPGEWFPPGEHCQVLYTSVPCRGCRLDICTRFAKMCILSITPSDVAAAVLRTLDTTAGRWPDTTGDVSTDSNYH